MDLDDLKPWQQQARESSRAHHAFLHFLNLPSWNRSMRQAYTDHQTHCKGKNPVKNLHASPDWQDWRFRHSWLGRAQAHDADVAERDRVKRLHDISKMNERHTQIAMALQDLVVERLQAMVKDKDLMTMTPIQLASLLDRATLVERRSRGEATAIVRHEGGDAGGAALDLSALTDAELDLFQGLVRKAHPPTTSREA